MVSETLLRIGTRGSPLALAQAHETARRLGAAHGVDPGRFAIVVFKTSGDRIQDRPLSEAGGKGLFTKELEQALLEGAIDIAAHSAKDMATTLPPGLAIAAFLEREDPRDALIAPGVATLADLPHGAVVGSASLRRQAQLKRLRPDLRPVLFRGNVETRLRKIAEGAADATLLALAGLKRLGLEGHASEILPVETFLPAVGQGAIALETREADAEARRLVAAIGHRDTEIAVRAERAFLAVLDGSCRTPIAGHARVEGGRVAFRGQILTPDGSEAHETEREGPAAEADALGRAAGEELRARGGPAFFGGPV
ncbi:hydroxymethylbilane synthase [Labrys wisconsinensis]|uniref:Porphobilinogen deaminase n=1 Tax=Labrys wisconsinensis TaxID=425677 RepID=A0ABU0J179_9HYPH|nr:hydroxymethylbilane synthase [Labrys wisconsinensis]MDQ0468004.1 hydroxymethylbilane synthase [Labrys wisconsinensis]